MKRITVAGLHSEVFLAFDAIECILDEESDGLYLVVSAPEGWGTRSTNVTFKVWEMLDAAGKDGVRFDAVVQVAVGGDIIYCTPDEALRAVTLDNAAVARQLALAHVRGIEGGLKGVLADLAAGHTFDDACGMGDSWDLPPGVTLDDVRAALRAIVAES